VFLWAIRITATEELALQHLKEGESALLGWTQLDYSNPSHNVVSPSVLKIIKHIGGGRKLSGVENFKRTRINAGGYSRNRRGS